MFTNIVSNSWSVTIHFLYLFILWADVTIYHLMLLFLEQPCFFSKHPKFLVGHRKRNCFLYNTTVKISYQVLIRTKVTNRLNWRQLIGPNDSLCCRPAYNKKHGLWPKLQASKCLFTVPIIAPDIYSFTFLPIYDFYLYFYEVNFLWFVEGMGWLLKSRLCCIKKSLFGFFSLAGAHFLLFVQVKA